MAMHGNDGTMQMTVATNPPVGVRKPLITPPFGCAIGRRQLA